MAPVELELNDKVQEMLEGQATQLGMTVGDHLNMILKQAPDADECNLLGPPAHSEGARAASQVQTK